MFFMLTMRLFWAETVYLLNYFFQAELLDSNPANLLILVLAGVLVVYVVIVFNKAQTLREREMLAAQTAREREMMNSLAAREREVLTTISAWRKEEREITERWLTSIETTSRDDNNAVRELAANMAAQTKQMEQLTAAINRSIELNRGSGGRREGKV